MKSIKENIRQSIEETKSGSFNDEQNYLYWAKEILKAITMSFDDYKVDLDKVDVDDWENKLLKVADDDYMLYDKLYCLCKCYREGQYNVNAIDRMRF